MTRLKKRRCKCPQENASASSLDPRSASQQNTAACAIDSRPAPKENTIAAVVDSRPAPQENAAASSTDSRLALQESASVSSLDSAPISSFEFSVTSEEGIELYVDMDSSFVDWHKRLENGMCACHCLEENKFRSFREELLYLGNNCKQRKDSFGWKSDGRMKDSNASFVSSSNSFNKKCDNSLLNHPDAKNGPSEIFAAEACNFVQEKSVHMEEQRKHLVSVSSNLDVKVMISSPRAAETVSTDPNAFHVPKGKSASCSMESLASDGLKSRSSDKNMKLHGEVSTNIMIKKKRNTKNVTQLPVSSGIRATESKLSEVSCPENDMAGSSFVNDPLLNSVDATYSMEKGVEELANSIRNEHHTHLNILSVETQATGGPATETEASCFSKSKKVTSDGEHKQKRYKNQFDMISLQYRGRILRSAMRPRRSQRLVSKVFTP